MSSKGNGLTLKHKIGYGSGDAGGVITLTMMSFMTRYITNILKIDTAVLATMLLVWNIWDAVNDPMMGTLMDITFAKAKTQKNKFRPWILASIPVMAFGVIAFYIIPSKMGGGFPMLFAIFCLKIVYEAGYTMMNIAMGSLLGVMATNDAERAGLASARGLGSTAGGLLGSIVVPQIIAKVGDNQQGYVVAAIASSILAGILVYFQYAWTEERNVSVQNNTGSESDKIKFTDILDVFKNNRAYLALCIHSVCICLGIAIKDQTGAYVFADAYGDIGLMSMSTMVMAALMVIVLVTAPKLAKKIELVKIIRIALIAGIILSAVVFVMSTFVDITGFQFLILSAIAGTLIQVSVQMQWGLVGESIDYNEYLTGKRTEGSIYGTFSLTRRIGTTIGSSLAVLMLGWINYDPNLAEAGLAQAESTLIGLKSMYVLAPAIGAIGSYLAFRFVWNINNDLREKIGAWRANKNG